MKKLKTILLIVPLLLSIFYVTLPAYAVSYGTVSRFAVVAPGGGGSNNGPVTLNAPQGVDKNIIVTKYIKPAIEFLGVGVGVVVLAMIIVGAIQYTTSSGNPQAVSDAKKRMFNAVLALLIYALLFAFLNFIIPGGLVTL